MADSIVHCSFCAKHKDQVVKLIVGNNAAICDSCVDFCENLLKDRKKVTADTGAASELPDPSEIKDFLDQYVIGQDFAKMVLSVAIANHYKRIANVDLDIEIQKVNILMIGPTGTGKTLLAKSVAKYLDVPFVVADATSLTEAGYVGDDVESLVGRLYAVANGDIYRCQRGIIFIDEVDKIARKSESAIVTRDVSGEGVQQALLKLVEGTKCKVPVYGTRKSASAETVEIDTTNILFIASGAFVGLDSIVRNRLKGTSIGFGAMVTNESLLSDTVSPDDLVRYGIIPEFVGRFGSHVTLHDLTKLQLIDILTGIKNNFVSQYKWLFGQDGVSLEFDPESLNIIAERTLQSKTGARGLQTELERVLLPHMFDLPRYRKQNILRVVINKELINTPMTLAQQNS